jgi:hypothetical protein
VSTGYSHPGYARSLREFGTPRALPRSGGFLLERQIPGSDRRDGLGLYPLFACTDWSALAADLEEACRDLVSVALVPDPFGAHDPELLRLAFDIVRPFKDHFVYDLTVPAARALSKHHRYYVKQAREQVAVEACLDPPAFLDEWVALYGVLVERHELRGIKAFSREAFAAQLAVPGIVVLRALHKGRTVGAHLWYLSEAVAYSHLMAQDAAGYEAGASYALYAAAIDHFASRAAWLDLGAGAGVARGSEGLTQFKRGFATGTRPASFCGRIGDPKAYADLAESAGAGPAEPYFPAYRRTEF